MYQFSKLTELYLNFNTIVNTKIEQIKFSELPAITVCYPIILSKDKIIEECENIFNSYLEFSQLKYVRRNTSNKSDEFDYRTYEKESIRLSNLIEKTSIECENQIYKKLVIQLYNYSITFNMNGNQFKHLIEAKAYGRVRDKFTNIKYTHIQNMNPIKSFTAINDERPNKCFTFFSKFNSRRDEFVMDLSHFEIEIRFNDSIQINTTLYSCPYDLGDYSIYFSLHSPLSLPQLTKTNYIKLIQNKEYKISFSRIVTKLLSSPFNTNCREYDILNNRNDQTKSDCIDRCIMKFMKDKCGNCLHRIGILYRFETMDNNQRLCENSSEFGQCMKSMNSEIRPKCETQCNNDCEEQFFDYTINDEHFFFENTSGLTNIDWEERNQILMEYSSSKNKIRIYHKSLPDTIIEYMPEISFTAYIAQLGGLAGMWLGLSAITIYDNSVQLILLCFEKLIFH